MLKPALFFLMLLVVNGCTNNTSKKIAESLSRHYNEYATIKNKQLKTLLIDSISFTLADSTAYFNHLLNVLDQRSQSYAKMARLRTDLAKASMDSFFIGPKKERDKIKMDKSLEALKDNEREWDRVNDSMDLLLNAIHQTDTTKKIFFQVSYSLKGTLGEEKLLLSPANAILNRADYKVVVADR